MHSTRAIGVQMLQMTCRLSTYIVHGTAMPSTGYVAGAQQVLVRVVRVEQRLGRQSLFHNAEGSGEYEDRGPAAATAAYDFPDQNRAAAVQRNEHHQGTQQRQRHIAEKEFGHQWSDQQEQQYRGHTGQPATALLTAPCPRCNSVR
jgi:hypothetical protein